MLSATFNLEAAKASRLNTAIRGIYPMPQIPDPEWVDPGDGSEAPLVDRYTSMQWVKIQTIKFWTRTVHRWEDKVAKEAAAVAEDPEIATFE